MPEQKFSELKNLGQFAAAETMNVGEAAENAVGSVNPLTLYKLLKFQYGEQSSSTCVNDVSYNPLTREMTIIFQQRGTYKYSNVPLDVYTDFETAGSRGTYFNLYIRPTYSYERIA